MELYEMLMLIFALLATSLYIFANVVQYAFSSCLPDSITFFRYAINTSHTLDSVFGTWLPGEDHRVGWYDSYDSPNFYIFLLPMIFLTILVLYSSLTSREYGYSKRKTIVTIICSTYVLLTMLFYFIMDSSHIRSSAGIRPLEYPPSGYAIIISMIIILVFNHKRVHINKHQCEQIIESKKINISHLSLFTYIICLYLFLSFFTCTITSGLEASRVYDQTTFDLFFPLFFGTYPHKNPHLLPGINTIFIPCYILGALPIILFIISFFKRFNTKFYTILKIIFSSTGIIYTVLTIFWFLDHFMVIAATRVKNPTIFNVAGANFYFTLILYGIILIFAIKEYRGYYPPRQKKKKLEPYDIIDDQCAEEIKNYCDEEKANIAQSLVQ